MNAAMNNYVRELIVKENIMVSTKEPTKEELFSALVICPKCNELLGMRVSSNKDYAFHCFECNEDFHVSECSSSTINHIGRLGKDRTTYTITLPGIPGIPNEDIEHIFEALHAKYKPTSLGCDRYSLRITDKYTFIDFSWNREPSDEMIQNLTDEVMKLWQTLKN